MRPMGTSIPNVHCCFFIDGRLHPYPRQIQKLITQRGRIGLTRQADAIIWRSLQTLQPRIALMNLQTGGQKGSAWLGVLERGEFKEPAVALVRIKRR